MTLGETIRESREKRGLTQNALATQIQTTQGFIAKLEKNETLASDSVLLTLADALALDRGTILELAEQVRQERSSLRIRTRGAAFRQSLGVAAQPTETAGGNEGARAEIVKLAGEILANPQLEMAVEHLQAALADPNLRTAVLKTLEAFALQARANRD